jgi:hypothetical protein
VVRALVALFSAFREQEDARLAAGEGLRKRRVVAPTLLREALSGLPGQAFQTGAPGSRPPQEPLAAQPWHTHIATG